MDENETLLQEFTEYCRQFPQERFWQALRNWSGMAVIKAIQDGAVIEHARACMHAEDTFYWTTRTGR